MGTLGLLILLFLAAKARSSVPSPVPPTGTPAASPAAPAAAAAAQKITEAIQLTAQANQQKAAAKTPPAWPQVVPAGLPPFPGPGWVAAVPLPPGAGARAWQLLSQLWQSGAGTFKTEMTGGQWITYVATLFPGGKKGVTAHKLRSPGPTANA